ncbi:hypothetical protein [Frankia sp. AgB32]|uniref:hypothetical protein n=1 Tax=Frankia sp. AgB32 TaxID=631119 RepID=UPI00200E2314|nr:hypothetical protein [Frankia sp. AgB32]MCK9896312.1 hypothetical protein [Frankia sp. AgB32]
MPPLLALAMVAAVLAVAEGSASAGNGSVNYTHSTTLSTSECPVFENFPKAEVPTRSWNKTRKSSSGSAFHVGVRYTYKGYALILDYAKQGDPTWGFIAQSCLTDPKAYDAQRHVLPDLQGVGGHGKPKTVPISADHAGKQKAGLIHLDSVGTLRSAPQSFVVGNARAGDPFYITAAHCGKHSTQKWILGYAPESGRWGYIQASHLPACQ